MRLQLGLQQLQLGPQGLALRGFDVGADIVMQALTKYQSGGSDVLMGAVITRDAALNERLAMSHMRLGMGVGAAMTGLRPVVELMTINFSLLALDQIVNHAATIHYMFGGQVRVPAASGEARVAAVAVVGAGEVVVDGDAVLLVLNHGAAPAAARR